MPEPSVIETYYPLFLLAGFFGAWCAAMLTGLIVMKAVG